ncbi:hypothetical protein B0H10DRAFT_1942211 [Mycena sp. CBHHK59/15]|nr:hypothetical protein B0H10DRAFT_1942211 [Mycena sp. CBHHK59/15]
MAEPFVASPSESRPVIASAVYKQAERGTRRGQTLANEDAEPRSFVRMRDPRIIVRFLSLYKSKTRNPSVFPFGQYNFHIRQQSAQFKEYYSSDTKNADRQFCLLGLETRKPFALSSYNKGRGRSKEDLKKQAGKEETRERERERWASKIRNACDEDLESSAIVMG